MGTIPSSSRLRFFAFANSQYVCREGHPENDETTQPSPESVFVAIATGMTWKTALTPFYGEDPRKLVVWIGYIRCYGLRWSESLTREFEGSGSLASFRYAFRGYNMYIVGTLDWIDSLGKFSLK